MAAERVGAHGSVAALDINAGMLQVARSLPSAAGPAIDWIEGSALDLPFTVAAFDVVLCQFGLQFFPDRPAALSEMARVLTPGGRLAVSVFSPIEHNPATNALAAALDRHLGPTASQAKRTEHALADTASLEALVAAAGFIDIVIETSRKTVGFPSVAEYVRIQLTGTPLASLLAGFDESHRTRLIEMLIEDVGAAVAGYVSEDEFAFPQEVHRLLARR